MFELQIMEIPTHHDLNNARNLLAYVTEKSYNTVGFRHSSIRNLDPLCISSLCFILCVTSFSYWIPSRLYNGSQQQLGLHALLFISKRKEITIFPQLSNKNPELCSNCITRGHM